MFLSRLSYKSFLCLQRLQKWISFATCVILFLFLFYSQCGHEHLSSTHTALYFLNIFIKSRISHLNLILNCIMKSPSSRHEKSSKTSVDTILGHFEFPHILSSSLLCLVCYWQYILLGCFCFGVDFFGPFLGWGRGWQYKVFNLVKGSCKAMFQSFS